MATSQVEVAEHLGCSQTTVSRVMAALGVKADQMTLDEARRAIFAYFQRQASGRANSVGDLAEMRARESRLKGDLLQIQIQEKARALVPADMVERAMIAIFTEARNEFLALPEKIAAELSTVHGVAIDSGLIDEYICRALTRLGEAQIDF